MRTAAVGMTISLILAVLGGALAWWLTTPEPLPPKIRTTERAVAAANGLRDAHVYVDPAARGAFTAGQLDRLERAAAASDPVVHVVIWKASYEAGYSSRADVMHQISTRLDRPGMYVEVDPGTGVDSTDVGLTGEFISFYRSPNDEWSSRQVTDELVARIQENDGRDYELTRTAGSSDYWGGTGGMVAAILLFGVLGGGVVGLIGMGWWFGVRQRRTARQRERTRS